MIQVRSFHLQRPKAAYILWHTRRYVLRELFHLCKAHQVHFQNHVALKRNGIHMFYKDYKRDPRVCMNNLQIPKERLVAMISLASL